MTLRRRPLSMVHSAPSGLWQALSFSFQRSLAGFLDRHRSPLPRPPTLRLSSVPRPCRARSSMHILWYTLVSLLLGSPLCCQISVFVFSKELMSCDPTWGSQLSRLDQSSLSSFLHTLAWLHAGGPLRYFKFPDELRLPGSGPAFRSHYRRSALEVPLSSDQRLLGAAC